jgi:hypothetical protein
MSRGVLAVPRLPTPVDARHCPDFTSQSLCNCGQTQCGGYARSTSQVCRLAAVQQRTTEKMTTALVEADSAIAEMYPRRTRVSRLRSRDKLIASQTVKVQAGWVAHGPHLLSPTTLTTALGVAGLMIPGPQRRS